MAANDLLLQHCQLVKTGLAGGEVIPFLGAGASLVDRPPTSASSRDTCRTVQSSPITLRRSLRFPRKGRSTWLASLSGWSLVVGDAPALQQTARDLRGPLPAEQAAPSGRGSSRNHARAGSAGSRTAHHHDELRRCAGARLPGGRGGLSTSSGTRPRPTSRAASCTSGRTASASRSRSPTTTGTSLSRSGA